MIRGLGSAAKPFFRPKSLRRQLLSRSLTILAILLALIGTLQYFFMKDFVYRNKAETLRSQFTAIPRDFFNETERKNMEDAQQGGAVQDPQQGGTRTDLQGRNKPDPQGFGKNDPLGTPMNDSQNKNKRFFIQPDTAIAFVDPTNGFRVPDDVTLKPPQLTAEEYKAILSELKNRNDPPYRILVNSDGLEQLVVFRGVGPMDIPDGVVQISTPTAGLQDMLIQQLMIFFGLSAFALLAGMLVSQPVMKRTLVPLSNIGSAVQKIDAGNLSERLPIHQGQEEIDRLSVSFNGMLERLETSFKAERDAKEQMRRFAADASHELRTPLTSIHGFLEILLRGAAEKPEQLYSALNSMYGESKRINKLVEDLLLLAKMDRAPQLQFKEVALDNIVREMEPQLRMLAGTRAIQFHLPDIVVGQFDPDKIKQVILNLFHNAVQHTKAEEGQITITLNRVDKAVELSIKDNGSGISEEHLPHVFERFYRSESSRTRRSGGAGLGLSITKTIVEHHGGIIRVESRPGEGTSFIIRLPLNSKE